MTVKLAPSLLQARNTIDVRWPFRERVSDGWIGDAAHQAQDSDHNPNARGLVDALDVDMFGGTTPVHQPSIVAGFIVHPATHYVIFNRRIYRREDVFRSRIYLGDNPHTGHCHCSIRQTPYAEDDLRPWRLFSAFPAWHTLRKWVNHYQDVLELQAYLNAWGASLDCDGDFGPHTDTAVRNFQHSQRITVDAIVGPITRSRLFS